MKLTLVDKIDEAINTKSFFWQSEKPVNYLPGQYIYYTLPKLNSPDSRGATRHFTLSSSPTEGYRLRLTTRIREESGYKRTLDQLPLGAIVEGEGPNGVFIFDEAEKNKTHIFIAGGIGITPFRCFIKYAIDKKWQTPIYLIYSNSNSNFTFKEELESWGKQNQNIHIEFIDTSKTGHLDKLVINKFIDNWKLHIVSCTFWVVGSPPMVDGTQTVLDELKINSDNIRFEKFIGY